MMRNVVVAALAASATGALWTWMRHRERSAHRMLEELMRKLTDMEVEAQRKEQQRQEERRGRVAAEQELRKLMDTKLDTANGLYVQPVGVVRSCFHSCLGTPRQGLFAPSTRGAIIFHRNISPDTLDGLLQFSHVWILFEFHQNTNGKNARAHAGLRPDSHRYTFKAKITPPRLKERVGIFSTRSPHRPNPIGVTLAKVDKIEGRSLYISALDLVDGTPVLDIKPYVPAYDAIPSARVAQWVSNDLSPTLHRIHWVDQSSRDELERLSAASKFYRGAPEVLRAAIEEVLLADVRTNYQTKRLQSTAYSELRFDMVRVRYRVAEQPIDRGGDTNVEILGVAKV